MRGHINNTLETIPFIRLMKPENRAHGLILFKEQNAHPRPIDLISRCSFIVLITADRANQPLVDVVHGENQFFSSE